jgi:hypothetical protein
MTITIPPPIECYWRASVDKRVALLAGSGVPMIFYGMTGHHFHWTYESVMDVLSDPFLVVGAIFLLTPLIANLLLLPIIGPIPRLFSPSWDGGVLYTHGGRHKVRYYFNEKDEPLFVVRDVCRLLATSSPSKGATHWHHLPLVMSNQMPCLSKGDLRTYLTPFSRHDETAKQLLLALRFDSLQKVRPRNKASDE